MTFTQIQAKVAEYCILQSDDALSRIGRTINSHYRRITASLGLDVARFVVRSTTTSLGIQTVTFTEIEKIDRLMDVTSSSRLLQETSVHEIRSNQAGNSDPFRWAYQNSDADSVTVVLDTVPQVAYSLEAHGWATVSDLADNDEPAFAESYHDVLVWYAISDELLKKEKDKLAAIYQEKADALLNDLRFFISDSHTRAVIQGQSQIGMPSGGGSTNGGVSGASSYTQTGLITFDRGPGIAPFAVGESDAAYVPNLSAETLGNITTNRVIGRVSAGVGETEQLTLGNGLGFAGTQIGIVNGGVTYVRMQNVTAGMLLGRGTGSTGIPQELSLGGALTMSGTTVSVSVDLDQVVLAGQVFS